MASTQLSLSSPDLLAEYVRQSELKGFFEKRLASPPDHMAMLIRDGAIVDTFKGAHFSIGGVFSKMREMIVGSSHVSILLADLKPFSLQSDFKAMSRDKVMVHGTATFELQVNPDKPANILGLMNRTGCLSLDEVLARFKPHLTDRVVEATVGRVKAEDLRGDRDVQDLIQADIMKEVERVAGDIGMMVRAVSMEWALTETEIEAMEQASLDREQSRLDNELTRLKQELKRGNDSTSFRIESEVELAKLQSASEEELSMMTLTSEVRLLDAREEAQRRQELEALAHEIKVLREERAGKFENQLAELDQTKAVADRQAKLQGLNREVDRLDQKHLSEMRKLQSFTDLEIAEREKEIELRIAAAAQKQGLQHAKAIQDMQNDSEDAELRRDLARSNNNAQNERDLIQTKADAKVAELEAGSRMTPEQILAINAGLSSDVAAVLAERARADGQGNQQSMELMREMVAQATDARVSSEAQALEMFRMGMEGASGVAAGAGGKPGAATIASSSETTIDCPNCTRENSAKAKHCFGCGTQLRV
jgi:hypothetical protein